MPLSQPGVTPPTCCKAIVFPPVELGGHVLQSSGKAGHHTPDAQAGLPASSQSQPKPRQGGRPGSRHGTHQHLSRCCTSLLAPWLAGPCRHASTPLSPTTWGVPIWQAEVPPMSRPATPRSASFSSPTFVSSLRVGDRWATCRAQTAAGPHNTRQLRWLALASSTGQAVSRHLEGVGGSSCA